MGMDIAPFGADANILLETFSENIPSLADIKENTDKMDENYKFEIVDFPELLSPLIILIPS